MRETEKRDGGRRVRVSLRTLLILVAVSGVVFGLIGRTIRYKNARAKRGVVMLEQYSVTNKIVNRTRSSKWLQSHIGPNMQWHGGSGSVHSGPSAWNLEQRRWGRNRDESGISIEIQGRLNGLEVKPIVIHDRESLYNRFLIA